MAGARMLRMVRALAAVVCLLSGYLATAQSAKPSFDFETASRHEIKPLRHSIPVKGVTFGGGQIGLKLTVSRGGDVLAAKPRAGELMKFWPMVEAEVLGWKFTPFEKDGIPVVAEVEEYIELVPQERMPTTHVTPPVPGPKSKVVITLKRGLCYGMCPVYSVIVSTDGIVFEGDNFVAAKGKQTAPVDADAVRELAKKFVDADFYSMDDSYVASVTDNPTYVLSISIDGRKKQVVDYVGAWKGMPAVITGLEEEVDRLADTERWIKGKAQQSAR